MVLRQQSQKVARLRFGQQMFYRCETLGRAVPRRKRSTSNGIARQVEYAGICALGLAHFPVAHDRYGEAQKLPQEETGQIMVVAEVCIT